MTVDFEGGRAVIEAGESGGFDPTEIPRAVEDAGFGPGEIQLRAAGILEDDDGQLALRLPAAPYLLLLAGGALRPELEAAGFAVGARIRVEGRLHPLQGQQPPTIEVDRWSEAGDAGEPVLPDDDR